LDFDFNLNKIPAEDYPVQRAELLQKGAEILKRLDSIAINPVPNSAAEDRVEQAVAARHADLSAIQADRDDDDIEAMIVARRKTRKQKSGGFCPRCGKPILASDRFCPHCGKSTN
jgi:NADH pyrophosphatase NudC (nudix superfamily)